MSQQQEDQSPNEIKFKTVEILKQEVLGIGSFGAVYKAKCDDLLCAAKILHPILFDPMSEARMPAHQRKHRLPIMRFNQECEFMSAIRHPNIVQYLGTHRDPETDLPVLLMELMENNLTHFLECSLESISFHVQINISHDIAVALSFLHSNGIIHRDMSSNNVLLIGNSRAKVTDFGMAKLGNPNPHVSLTMCPGTDVYMPPEAFVDKLKYSDKIDCFSFGVLGIQILTCEFPNPGDKMKTVFVNHPDFPDGIPTLTPEIERRQNHISQINPDNPLLPIILDCLKDKDVHRPSSHTICQMLETLKHTSSSKDLEGDNRKRSTPELEQFPTKIQQIEDLKHKLKISQQLVSAQKHEIEHKTEQMKNLEYAIQQCQTSNPQVEHQGIGIDQLVRKQGKDSSLQSSSAPIFQTKSLNCETEYAIQQCQTGNLQEEHRAIGIGQVERKHSNLRSSSAPTFQTKSLNRETECQGVDSELQEECTNTDASTVREVLKLSWKKAEKAPHGMITQHCGAVVNGSKIYFKKYQSIYAYDSTNTNWSQVLDCPFAYCALEIVNGNLTTIGGGFKGKETNQLFSLSGEDGGSKTWIESLPPMPTKRSFMMAICNGNYLIVAGGERRSKSLTSVEVLNTNTVQWSTTSTCNGLPFPLSISSAAICGDRIYMLGMKGTIDSQLESVLFCSMSSLLQSCGLDNSSTLQNKVKSSSSATVWNEVADIPVIQSTLVAVHNFLLAIGGRNSDYKPSSAIRMFDAASNSWKIISKMTTPRYLCYAVFTPSDHVLMVVGGYSQRYLSGTDAVETASLQVETGV